MHRTHTLRRIATALPMALALATQPACGTLLVAGRVSRTYFVEGGSHETREPLGTPQASVTVEPAPPPALGFRCTVERRWAGERVIVTRHPWDIPARLGLGFVFLGEAALSGASFAGAFIDPTHLQPGWIVPGVLLGVDALTALGFILFSQSPRDTQVTESHAAVTRRSFECPAGVVVLYAERELAVQPNGALAPADQQWLLDRVINEGAELRVRVGARVGAWQATTEDRCALARQYNHPAASALCPAAPAVIVEPAVAPVPVSPAAASAPVAPGGFRLTIELDGGLSVQPVR